MTVNNRMCEMFGIEAPIFAFSHCRDVVVEVSKAGGLGVLGMARMSPERVDEELRWIDAHIDGKPYGIDILNPATYEDTTGHKFEPDRLFPPAQRDFVKKVLDDAGIPPLPEAEADAIMRRMVNEFTFTPAESARMAKHCHLVVMALEPREEIGAEVHRLRPVLPNHRDGIVHRTRADAEADNEHFDGITTE